MQYLYVCYNSENCLDSHVLETEPPNPQGEGGNEYHWDQQLTPARQLGRVGDVEEAQGEAGSDDGGTGPPSWSYRWAVTRIVSILKLADDVLSGDEENHVEFCSVNL